MNPNRLQHEKSPYLLQHADNPVDWYPWGEAAFTRAREEDRPVFLSIGYATCHWCHVMAHESFSDPSVAALLNGSFVCIKVDREERPEIDGIYMRVCQALIGSGGWPLTIVMTPEGRPFFAATYLPKEERWGRPGLMTLLPKLAALWRTRRPEIEQAAAETVSRLGRAADTAEALDAGLTTAGGFAELEADFDAQEGGFGEAPKFPMPHQLIFLLRHGWRTGSPLAREMATRTLAALRRGGICDQLGHGFHRYSTDRQWLVPHFEKMLYDQALLTLAYLEAFQATGNQTFGRTSREIIGYCLSDLRSPEGGFYSAEDADSEGEEGRFYLWRLDEVRKVLEPGEADFAAALFGLSAEGNVRDPATGAATGENCLHLAVSPEEMAGRLGLSEPAFAGRFEAVRRKLLAARALRPRPLRDEKILTDWNGLMIAALARASRVLGEPTYLAAARAALACVRTHLTTPSGRLLHRLCQGEAALTATLDDYAFLIWGLLETYEAGFDPADLREALALQGVLDGLFRDEGGGYFATPADGEALIARLQEHHDGAIPSGNAATFLNLIRLGRLTGDTGWEEKAAALARAFGGAVSALPSAHAQWLCGLEWLAAPACEAVIAGERGMPDTEALLAVLSGRYFPSLSLHLYPSGRDGESAAALAPFLRGMGPRNGRAAAYLCQGFACREPVTSGEALAALLDGLGPP